MGRVLRKQGAIWALGSLSWFLCSLGGATQPQGPHSRLEEVSPLVEDIEVIKGDPYFEVFIRGRGHLDCYDAREYAVEKGPHETRIIPRLKRAQAQENCKLGLKFFRDKAADLDPHSPSSENLWVLGFSGWHRRVIAQILKDPEPKNSESK